MEFQEKLGKNLRKVRLKKRFTQSEVAEKAKIHPNYYAKIERGETNPSAEIITRIVKVLKVNLKKILP